ncbi:MAG: DNA repair protein RecO [Pseudomonadota bacterium]
MSHYRVVLQPAYVLHQRPYRDTSALVELFSADFGRVGAVARGARAAKSRMQGLLQPFQPLLVSWSGRGELVTLTGCEAAGPAQRPAGATLLSGFYMNELLLRLLHRHDPHRGLFESYAAALRNLEDVNQEQRTLRIFEKHLLQELGYALVLNHCADTGAALQENRLYSYQLEKGPLDVDAPRPYDITVHGRTLLALDQETLHDGAILREAKRLTRAALALYLGDKPLRSRALLVDWHRAAVA